MKTLALNLLAVIATFQTARADVQDRVLIKEIPMDVVATRFGFEKARDARIELYAERGEMTPSTLVLTYEAVVGVGRSKSFKTFKHDLKITSIRDNCGSTLYHASYEGQSSQKDVLGGRFNVTLQDNTYRRCDDLQPARFIANVRSGYGFCGTMDATMTLMKDLYIFPMDQIQE